jgi:hypothetical protein
MGLFDPPSAASAMPRRWADYSLEYQGMFAYHIAMMAMMVTGLVPVPYEIAVAGGIVAVIATASIGRRQSLDWQWPGLARYDLLKAALIVAAGAVFLYVATVNFKADDPHLMPWFLAGLGIILFNVLSQLKLVTFSEEAFAALGKPAEAPAVEIMGAPRDDDGEPSWHRTARAAYRIGFFAIWLTFLAFFYLNSTALRDGVPQPTATASAPITDHGRTVYIARDRAGLIDLLSKLSLIGIPLIVLSGFALQYAIGVRLFTPRTGRDAA